MRTCVTEHRPSMSWLAFLPQHDERFINPTTDFGFLTTKMSAITRFPRHAKLSPSAGYGNMNGLEGLRTTKDIILVDLSGYINYCEMYTYVLNWNPKTAEVESSRNLQHFFPQFFGQPAMFEFSRRMDALEEFAGPEIKPNYTDDRYLFYSEWITQLNSRNLNNRSLRNWRGSWEMKADAIVSGFQGLV